MIRDLGAGRPPETEPFDVVVIGSGSGGATAARVLAEGGRQVLVLEEGGDFTGPKLTQRESEMYDQLYMERGARATDDLSITVLQGRVLGGGGVINASDVVPIPDEVLRHWQKHHGLTAFSPEALRPHADAALADLSASRIQDGQVNAANKLLQAGAQKLGVKGEVMLHNRVGCIGTGTCLIGCSFDAKRSPRLVAVPAAEKAGAEFWIRARAVRIDDADRELKTVEVRMLDGRGYHERGETRVRARTVILAANAVASAQLLLRSGLGNEHVGRNLTLQPQLPVVALFEQEVRAFRGIPQSYAVTEWERLDEERGLGGFRIEGIMGTPGIVASLLPRTGHEGKALMTRYPHLAASLCLCPDVPSGTVELRDDGRPRIRYAPTAELHDRFRAAAKAAARLYLAAGAAEVIVPTSRPVRIRREADLAAVDALDFAPATAPLISAHQQGTVRFAASPEKGGADPDGQVWGTKGVYVFDSSGYPTTSSSHTMAPILTTSRYLSAALLARLPP